MGGWFVIQALPPPGSRLNESMYDDWFPGLHKVEAFVLCCHCDIASAPCWRQEVVWSFIWASEYHTAISHVFHAEQLKKGLTTWLHFTSKFDIISYHACDLWVDTQSHTAVMFSMSWHLKREIFDSIQFKFKVFFVFFIGAFWAVQNEIMQGLQHLQTRHQRQSF